MSRQTHCWCVWMCVDVWVGVGVRGCVCSAAERCPHGRRGMGILRLRYGMYHESGESRREKERGESHCFVVLTEAVPSVQNLRETLIKRVIYTRLLRAHTHPPVLRLSCTFFFNSCPRRTKNTRSWVSSRRRPSAATTSPRLVSTSQAFAHSTQENGR